MRSCQTCPGGAACAGENVSPVLTEVHALYCSGITDKFDILFALKPEFEDLIEHHNDKISEGCWTKAALLTMSDIVAKIQITENIEPAEAVREAVGQAIKSFENFPWQVSELIEQAPDLYEATVHRNPDTGIISGISKRAFIKLCKEIVYA